MKKIYALLFVLLCNVAQASQDQSINKIIAMVNNQTSATVNETLSSDFPLFSGSYPLEVVIKHHSCFFNTCQNLIQFHPLIDHLLQLGANPNLCHDIHLINIVIQIGDYTLFKKILDKSTTVPSGILLYQLRHLRMVTNDLQCVCDTLIQRGAKMNARDIYGKTLLFQANALTPETLWYFLNRGIKTTIKDNNGSTYLEDYAMPSDQREYFPPYCCPQPRLDQLRQTGLFYSKLRETHDEESQKTRKQYKDSLRGIIFTAAVLQCIQGNPDLLYKIVTQSPISTLARIENMMEPGEFDSFIRPMLPQSKATDTTQPKVSDTRCCCVQ